MFTSFREHEKRLPAPAISAVMRRVSAVSSVPEDWRIWRRNMGVSCFVMEVHLHFPQQPPEPWLNHFGVANPLFNEQLELRDGRLWDSIVAVPFHAREQARRWTILTCEFGKRS